MIWYDAQTHEPVAPGACEDAGTPSIHSYECYKCRIKRSLIYDRCRSGKIEVGIGRCKACYTILLTTV